MAERGDQEPTIPVSAQGEPPTTPVQGRGSGARIFVIVTGMVGLVALAALGVALSRGVGQPSIGATDAGFDVAGDFTLPDLEGGTFTLSEHAQGPVFLYFWASWCQPCREEAPIIQRLWPEYRDRGYTFVGVNIIDSEDAAREFIDEFGLSFPMVRDVDGAVYLDYGVYGVPESFFLAPGLEVDTKFLGTLTEESLRDQLDRSVQ